MSRLSSERSGTERATFVSEDAPEVSRGFVPRPDAARAVRSRIAGGVGSSPPVVVLYGPAGTGKTALVAAIAQELARGTAGRRSVLWLNLARSSDHLDGLMQAIGVIERHVRTPTRRKGLARSSGRIDELQRRPARVREPRPLERPPVLVERLGVLDGPRRRLPRGGGPTAPGRRGGVPDGNRTGSWCWTGTAAS